MDWIWTQAAVGAVAWYGWSGALLVVALAQGVAVCMALAWLVANYLGRPALRATVGGARSLAAHRRAHRDRRRSAQANLDAERGGPSWLSRAGEMIAWAISLEAYALSYVSLYSLAKRHGFAGPLDWEALAWPTTVDLASFATGIIALDQAQRGKSAWLAWAISTVAAAIMVVGNIISASGDWVSIGMHAWPPMIALACWFLLVHVRRSNSLLVGLFRVVRGDGDADLDADEIAEAAMETAPTQAPEIVAAAVAPSADPAADEAPVRPPVPAPTEPPGSAPTPTPTERRRSAGSTGDGSADGAPTGAPGLRLINGRRDSANKTKVRRLYRQYVGGGKQITGALVAEKTGLSQSRARELLGEVRLEEEADAPSNSRGQGGP